MALIDIGPGATDRTTEFSPTYTRIDLANPANATGKITLIELWYGPLGNNATGVKVGTFSGSGTSYTPRDFETIGAVIKGSKQTFSGLDCDITSGDFIGLYGTDGSNEGDLSGGTGYMYKAGDQFGAGTQTYTDAGTLTFSVYGTGSTLTKLIGTDVVAANTGGLANYASACRWAASANGSVTTVRFWAVSSTNIKVGIYTGTNYPTTQVAVMNTSTAVTGGQWNEIILTAPVSVVSGTNYWIVILQSQDSTLKYGTEASRLYKARAVTYADGLAASYDSSWDDAANQYGSFAGYGSVFTSVSDIFQLVWDIRKAISDTSQEIWNVRKAISDTVQTVWKVISFANDTLQAVWNTKELTNKSSQLVWNIKTFIGQTVEFIWNVEALIANDVIQLVWHVKKVISDQVQAVWNVRKAISDTIQAVWKVIGAINQTLQAVWNVRYALSDTLQTIWHVKTFVGDVIQTIWNVLNVVPGSTSQLIWNTREAINDTIQTVWHIRSIIADSLQTIWNVGKTISDTIQALWNVKKFISDTTQIVYNVRMIVGNVFERLIGSDNVSVDDTVLIDTFHLSKFTALLTGEITQIPIYSGGIINVKVAIYTDNAGEPGALLNAVNDAQAVIVGWNNIAFPATVIVQGTDYWLALNSG